MQTSLHSNKPISTMSSSSSSFSYTPRPSITTLRQPPHASSFYLRQPVKAVRRRIGIRSWNSGVSIRHSPHLESFPEKAEVKTVIRRSGIRSWNSFRGVSIRDSRLKVMSYLPNLESFPEKEEVISSSSLPSLTCKSRIEEVTGVRTLGSSGKISLDTFRGKSGCVSFYGLSHQIVESKKLVSSPFEDGKGSLIWVVAPVTLILSLVLPQFFLDDVVEAFLKNEVLTDIVTSFSSEIIFYTGLGVFLRITDRVQRPYIDFSPKQWSLITGLRGYMSSAFFTMGIKVVAPLVALYVVWPVIALPAVVAVSPFLLGCAVQFAFELLLEKSESSCWPVLPIIFEVYRLYQLCKASYFLEKLIFSMKGRKMTPKMIEKGNAMCSLVVLFQILAVVCMWSLTTFLIRLFPSRPVAENY